jgi:hypothetical protein
MESNVQPPKKRRAYDAPRLDRVHLDPVKDLLMACAGNDPAFCDATNGGLTS